MTYEPRWQERSGGWANPIDGEMLFEHQLWQTIGGDWDPKLRDEFLDREWDRVQGGLNRPAEDTTESDGAFLPRIGIDVEKWTNEFLARFAGKYAVMERDETGDFTDYADISPTGDLHDTVRAWFANAIGAGMSSEVPLGNPQPNWDLPGSLMQWWMETAERDCFAAAAKLGEYGSYDLLMVGEMLAHMAGWDDATVTQMTELGTWFYLVGKIARGYDAVREHRLPSDDTVHDIKVYATMIERIRQHGSWA